MPRGCKCPAGALFCLGLLCFVFCLVLSCGRVLFFFRLFWSVLFLSLFFLLCCFLFRLVFELSCLVLRYLLFSKVPRR